MMHMDSAVLASKPESNMSDDNREPNRNLSAPDDAPAALLAWAREAYSDEIVVSRVEDPYTCQGAQALPGDWFVEFDGMMGVLWRFDGPARLVVVTRNDGMGEEALSLA